MSLPELSATLNSIAAILLVTGYCAIRAGNEARHARLMTAALATSVLFLASYLTHHFTAPELSVKYAGPEMWRLPYLTLLLAHTPLAALVPFLAIRTIILGRRAISGDEVARTKHVRLAKITFPIWMFVSISGVLIYFILYQWTDSWQVAIGALEK
ncbi:MAG: hypothetical protein COB96_05385 [Planctomycetota bacterium]|nr:MAG: hypothetical protein COB96_05385 [Planctomycetota bacterium]